MSVIQDDKTSLLYGCRAAVISVAAVSLFSNLLVLAGPLFMLQVYDRVLASGSVPTLIGLSVFVAIAYIFYGLLEMLRARILTRIATYFDARLSPIAFRMNCDMRVAGGEASQPIDDLDRIRQVVGSSNVGAVFDVPWMPVYLIVIFLLHPLLGLVSVLGALVIIFLMIINTQATRKQLGELSKLTNQRKAMSDIGRANAEVIAGMGMMHALTERWRTFNRTYADHQTPVSDAAAMYSSTTKSARMGLQSLILGTGAYLAIQQQITPGVMIAASIISARALAPVEQVVAQWRHLVNAKLAYGRLRKLVAADNAGTRDMELDLPHKLLSVEDLCVAPPGKKELTVRGVTFKLEAGMGLGVLGSSGSGKSTVARALVGAWSPLRGGVRLDGALTTQWSDERRGEFIGYLPQDIELFDGTIAQNISRFRADADDAKIKEAAKRANVHDLIVSFEDGYDTQIGAHGSSLSGGQRQRIALARAIYGKPFMVVLDEPNSNLDTVGEFALRETIELLREEGCVVIVVTHRERTLVALSHLLVMHEGAMRHFGTKEEVLPEISPAHRRLRDAAQSNKTLATDAAE